MIPLGAPLIAVVAVTFFDIVYNIALVLTTPSIFISSIETAGIVSILSSASASVADSV